MPKQECVSCGNTTVEELAVDEYDETWCQTCIDALPEDELEGSEWRAFTDIEDDDEATDS